MKLKMIYRLILFFVFFCFGTKAQDIPAKPNPPKLVNDFVGGLLSDAQKEQLERKLVAYNDSTSTQITVVISKNIEPYESSEYAFKLGREWGVGSKDFNNGIVLLWIPSQRKIFIATGYGMEGVLPDIYARQIISNVIGPRFKAIQYYEGLNEGTDEIIKYASGEYKAQESDEDGGFWIFLLLIFLVLIALYFIGKSNKGGGRGLRESSSWPYTTYTGWGNSSGNWSSGGSSWGGGSDGGGFGGFGGGSFGGGGAGGDY
jgi:uncharacterized protein